MVPIIQFDPATMSMVYEMQMIGGIKDKKIAEAIEAVTDGNSQLAIATMLEMNNGDQRDRAIQILSAIWHEKRHFLDFLITNYGAFRFRQFSEMYANMPAIMKAGQALGHLHMPLEVYGDPVRRQISGINETHPDLVQIANALSFRRKMIEKDRQTYSSRFGETELGGEAQLEFLAYTAQASMVQTLFGADGLKQFFDSVPDKDQFLNKYQSITDIASKAGVLNLTDLDSGVMLTDITLLECIVFASLQTDHLPGQDNPSFIETSYPAERFAAILTEIVQTHPKLCNAGLGSLDFDTCWSVVDSICESLFGKSVLEQMRADRDHFQKEFESKVVGMVPDNIQIALQDYLSTRSALIEEFASDPSLFISGNRFCLELADRLEPNHTVCGSGGEIGNPPDRYDRLMGYEHPDADFNKHPYAKWWWVCCPNAELRNRRLSEASTKKVIGFDDPKSWYEVLELYSPIAKLLMNGRKIRTLIGPELLFAEQRLQSILEIDISIYPSFRYPDKCLPINNLYHYYGTKELKCDLTFETITKPDGVALHPWTLRRWPKLAQYVIEKLGGNDLAILMFWRDWSPWIVSESEYESLKPLMTSTE